MHFYIDMKLPSLNEYINACRSSRYGGATFKTGVEDNIIHFIHKACLNKTLKPMGETPCELVITFFEKTKKRDVDNIQSSVKFILDALQKAGILKNDSRKYVKQIYSTVKDADENRVLVEFANCEEENEQREEL